MSIVLKLLHFKPIEVIPSEEVPVNEFTEILTEMKKDGEMFFRVRWVGYGSDNDSDEPEELCRIQ